MCSSTPKPNLVFSVVSIPSGQWTRERFEAAVAEELAQQSAPISVRRGNEPVQVDYWSQSYQKSRRGTRRRVRAVKPSLIGLERKRQYGR